MPYEIDFLGNSAVKKDADAICFRFWDNTANRYIICVYDGGTSDYGESIVTHLNTYYENPDFIDFVICSHPDLDHASGLQYVLENYDVKHLVLNRPWLYTTELLPKVEDGRITPDSLDRQLREAYPYAEELERIACRRRIPIISGLVGSNIHDKLKVLSPTKSFYLDLIAESAKTPSMEAANSISFGKKIIAAVKKLFESWQKDSLHEDVVTSAENETSIIIHGTMEEGNFLLTGDSGIRALDKAISYFSNMGLDISRSVLLYQIPHHGGRHNLSPSIMDRLVGPIVPKGETTGKQAVVSVAKDSDHPRKMVTNAFIRRGCKVHIAAGDTVCYNEGIPRRVGWSSVSPLGFAIEVENWDE